MGTVVFSGLEALSYHLAMTDIRQNFHIDTEKLINEQIHLELNASYVYLSMSAYFGRPDIALLGFSKRFRENSYEEMKHAEKLIDYQNMRGGKVLFKSIDKPSSDDWGTALEAVTFTLDLEKRVNESLLALHKVAVEHNDAQLTDFLERIYLEEQVESICEIGCLITKIKRVGDGTDLYVIDRQLEKSIA